jgi:hypothetical protein
MDFFLEKRLVNKSTKRLLWLPLLFWSALLVQAQGTAAPATPPNVPATGSRPDSPTPSPKPAGNTPASASANSPLRLNGQEPGNTEVNLSLSPDGQAPIYLTPTAPIAKRTQYTITAINFPVNVTLRQENHGGVRPSLTFYLGTDTAGNSPANASSSPPTNPLSSITLLTLAVDVLPRPGDQYTGNLLLTSEDNYTPVIWKINIKPATGILALDMVRIDRNLTYWPWGTQSDCITVNVREKTGRVLLDGVSASLEQVIKSPGEGFDLKSNVEFFFNGQNVPDFTQWLSPPPPSSQSTSPQAPATQSPSTQPSPSPPSPSASSASASPSTQLNATQSKNSDQGCGPDSGQPSSQAQDGQASRSIAANNGLATVGLRVHGLKAGEYNVVIRFQSSNSSNDDAKLVLNLQVRHHWTWPLLVLILAVILSFAATKVVSSLRQRFNFMRRIEELKPAWLNDEPKLLPVVWAQAILRQSQDLSKRFWLTGEDQIEQRVTQVEGMMKVLDRIRVLRNDIQSSALRKYVKYRAIAQLNAIVSSIGSGFVDDATVKDLNDSLTNLRQWLDDTVGPRSYWRDFRMDIALLLSEVEPSFFPDLYNPLREVTEQNPPAQDPPKDVIHIEEQYAKMKLVWERRNAPPQELEELKTAAKDTTKAKEEIFRQADQEAWNRLKKENDKGALKIKIPTVDAINPLAEYTPAQFSIEPTTDESLAETYLFRHGLKFEWTFTVTLAGRSIPRKLLRGTLTLIKSAIYKLRSATLNVYHRALRKSAEKLNEPDKQRTMKLTPVTEEPQVIQYFPQTGEAKVEVKISWKGAPGELITLPCPAPLPISVCYDFNLFRGLEKVEVISFFVAAFAAILTGITTFYLKNTGFGTASDYLTLFAWGFGVDQSKNFLQNLQAYSK